MYSILHHLQKGVIEVHSLLPLSKLNFSNQTPFNNLKITIEIRTARIICHDTTQASIPLTRRTSTIILKPTNKIRTVGTITTRVYILLCHLTNGAVKVDSLLPHSKLDYSNQTCLKNLKITTEIRQSVSYAINRNDSTQAVTFHVQSSIPPTRKTSKIILEPINISRVGTTVPILYTGYPPMPSSKW